MDGEQWETLGVTLYEEETVNELYRCYGMFDKDQALVIGELMRGAQSKVIFDSEVKHRFICVPKDKISSFAPAMGLGPIAADEVLDALKTRLAKGTMFLSDIMDVLDGTGVPYTFVSQEENGDLAFRPSQDAASKY